jgi:hypothetical protein
MILLALIEVKTDATTNEARLRQLLHDDIRGCLEYAANYELERIDVAGVDGVTEESILQELPQPKFPLAIQLTGDPHRPFKVKEGRDERTFTSIAEAEAYVKFHAKLFASDDKCVYCGAAITEDEEGIWRTEGRSSRCSINRSYHHEPVTK